MKTLDSGEVTFQSEGRLLQELGERLVASPEVAILELIKNSYDADAGECQIELPDARSLTISDDGHGMTLADFKTKWMRIATGSKQAESQSKLYHRKMTGAKGIGRFAVRYLGRTLHLESVAHDPERKTFTKLIADFNWSEFDKAAEMSSVVVPYQLEDAGGEAKTGTVLTIRNLHASSDKVFSSAVNTEVLKIVSPLTGLETGKFAREVGGKRKDPGFSVSLPTDATDESRNLAKEVLSSYWARLVITLDGGKLDYKIFFQGKEKPALKHNQEIESRIRAGLFADIRFFPKRPGIFSKKGFDGREAWKWVMKTSGVAVVDHGFRMKPYGYGDDDWLKLSQDSARNKRDWRSAIAEEYFPIPPDVKKKPSLNPMLYLPANHQLVGAVFVESGHESESGELDLTPSTDREGYLRNEALDQLFEIVRAGVEMLAVADKKEVERLEAEEARIAAEHARADIRLAIKHVERSTTLTQADKNRIVSAYTGLAKHIDEVDEYHRRARQSLEIMSLLGVVAGFMTHESRRILRALERSIKTIKRLAEKNRELREDAAELEDAYSEFSGHVDYTETFVEAVQNRQKVAFKARAQVDRITRKFKSFLRERKIVVAIEIGADVDAPPTQVALYSGIVLNLYTNAIKAVIAGHKNNSEPKIVFKGWNEDGKHVLEVIDNGVGIPPEIEQRIWDPLFTTTSSLNNPMGTGMGLGLSLVKKLVTDVGGSIRLVKAPPGFSTCFRMELPKPK